MVLSIEADELGGLCSVVAITGRVYTSGVVEYLIVGEMVRLKDVRDILFDPGLGSRGYSVLERPESSMDDR